MCQHLFSAKSVTVKIEREISPVILNLFYTIEKKYELFKENNVSHEDFFTKLKSLKAEFSKLSSQEFINIFPNVLEMFDKKDSKTSDSKMNIKSWLDESLKKEKAIQSLLKSINKDNEKNQPYFPELQKLIHILESDYQNEKDKWHHLLDGFQRNCACFRKNIKETNVTFAY